MAINKKFIILFCLIVLLFPAVLLAQTAGSPTAGNPPPVSLANPLGSGTTPQELIGRVINAVLGIVGSIALVMFIYGGFTWMTSSGNMEKVTKGKNILVWATIGLVVIFASYALVNFVIFEAIKPSP